MARKTRTILIIEDEEEYNQQFKEYCEAARNAICLDFDIDIDIKQAFSYTEAQDILNNDANLDLVSFDLRLAKNETSPSGMQLLRNFRKSNNRAIAIVVSGEPSPVHSIEALQKRLALAYIYKGDAIQGEQYEYIVRVALRYLELETRIAEMEQQSELDSVRLDAAEEQWKKLVLELEKADIDIGQLPSDLASRFKLLHSKLYDINTGLPIGKLLLMHLMQRVFNKDHLWSLMHVNIENYKIFEDEYPSKTDDLLKAIANILKKLSQHYRDCDPYIGFLNRPPVGPSFLIILREEGNELAGKLKTDVLNEFNGDLKGFGDNPETIFEGPKTFVSETEIRVTAKERAEADLKRKYQEPFGLEYEAEKKQLIAQYVSEQIAKLAPRMKIEIYSSPDDYFGDMSELIDTLAENNRVQG